MLVVGWGTSMLVISPTDEKIPMISNFHHTMYGMFGGPYLCY